MITLFVAAMLLVIVSLAAYHAIPPVRRVRRLFVLLAIFCVGWLVSFTFLVMPTQAFSGRESLAAVSVAYAIGFTVIFMLLGTTAMALISVDPRARRAGLAGWLAGALLGALLMSVAVADVQASDLRTIGAGGGVGWIRNLSSTIERKTGDELFWVFSMSALLMPWAAGLGAAAIKTRSIASVEPATRVLPAEVK